MAREGERDMTRLRKNPPLIERGIFDKRSFCSVTIRLSPYMLAVESALLEHSARASLFFGAVDLVC